MTLRGNHSFLIQLLVLLVLTFFGTGTHAQNAEDGFKSNVFDLKYIPFEELMITPKTHPGLFSFTGRWHRRRERFTSSVWPGTYLTALIYGSTCIVKLRPEHVGPVRAYSFYVSIDGLEDSLYTLPPFDSLSPDREIIYVPITMPADAPEDNRATTLPKASRPLKPHTVRITSIADTPFSFEGFLVKNTLIKQGLTWTEAQDERISVEFVGEGIDAEVRGGLTGWIDNATEYSSTSETKEFGTMLQVVPKGLAILNSNQFKAAELAGVRHSHISADVCLMSHCDVRIPLPGLMEQYFHEDPIVPPYRVESFLRGDRQQKQSLQQDIQFFAKQPWVHVSAPTHVFVDLGVRDIVLSSTVTMEEYGRSLMVFLGMVRAKARPNAQIIVVGRDYKSSASTESLSQSFIPNTRQVRTRRTGLFQTTQKAVEAMQMEDSNIIFFPITPSSSPVTDLGKALCESVIPPLGPQNKPSRSQKYCKEISSLRRISTSVSSTQQRQTTTERWHLWYFLFMLAFCGGVGYVLRQPILVVLGKARRGRKVYGVREMEGGMGMWKGKRRSSEEDSGFVVLGNHGGNKWKGSIDKKG